MSSLNDLAEARSLPKWRSWQTGRPSGYFDDPAEVAEFYRENGFCVLDQAFSREEVEAICEDAVRVCRGDYGDFPGLEKGPSDEAEDDLISRYLCLHFPHKVSKTIAATINHPKTVDVLTRIIGPNVKCMQSMLFIKASGKPGQAWHQDEIYIPTRDRSLTGAWIALDDATVENGCLWVLPCSNKPGILYYQEWHADSRFDCSWEARRFPYSNDQAVPVEVKAGSIVFFNGYTLHRSLPNYAQGGFRRALVNHYMSAESLLPWSEVSGPVATADFRDIVLVAGEDPYAWKGVENKTGLHARPSGEGGCGNDKYNLVATDRSAFREPESD
jgi:ectoine hydroxylase-related dioxygenase (phytanoyl-CoA dioxygenase family)